MKRGFRRARVLVALLIGATAPALLVGGRAFAVAGGDPVADGADQFAVKLTIGDQRSCSGALIDPQWVITARSCFADGDKPVTAGPPAQETTATIGRADLSGVAGRVMPVVQLVPHPDRDVVLAKLSLRVTDVVPVQVATSPTAVGDTLQVAGYGRTATEWIPDRLQQAGFTVRAVSGATVTLDGSNPATVSTCKGDAGAPALRVSGSRTEVVALNTVSWQHGCLGEGAQTNTGSTAVRLDDLQDWIRRTTVGLAATFGTAYSSTNGFSGFDLSGAQDQVVAFDYEHTGKLDHLLLYHPGIRKAVIVKHNPDGTFTQVFSSTNGIGGFDLAVDRDRIVPFDYDHSGKLDHLLVYRPGDRVAWVVKHNADDTFSAVYTGFNGIGGYDLASTRDQVVAFDYEHTGKLDHLLVYRPGDKVAWVVRHNADNSFGAVYNGFNGIGGFDLAVDRDRIVPFDYDHSGKLDHLLVYRPGDKVAWVVKHNPDNSFSAAYMGSNGIGGYDLASTRDQVVAFDYEHTGKPDHLLLYRPGDRIAFVVRHNADNSFSAVYNGFNGIGGYDLAIDRDRVVAFDYEHSGGANYLLLYRPGDKIAYVVGRQQGIAAAAAGTRAVTGTRALPSSSRGTGNSVRVVAAALAGVPGIAWTTWLR